MAKRDGYMPSRFVVYTHINGIITFMDTRGAQKIGKSKVTQIDKGTGQRAMFGFEWGVYFWRLPSGHLFKDSENRPLCIESVKGDIQNLAELRAAAAYYGEPDGEPWFYAGITKVTDEEYQVQKERLEAGLIPSENDFGAIHAAQQTLKVYGDEE